MVARPARNGSQMASRCAPVSPVQSASTNRNASASDDVTPSSIACAFDPSVRSRTSTFAPAARASSAVSSAEPSSTTITSRAYRQARAAATLSATVGASSRAGMTMSMTVNRGLRLRSGHPVAFALLHELDRHLAGRLVDHLVTEHDCALAIALGRGLLVRIEDIPRLVELL